MAGSHLPNGSEEEQQGIMLVTTTTATAGDHWEVQYARFFNCPSLSSSAGVGGQHPSLIPLVKRRKGLWISSFTSLSYLKLITTTTDESDNSRSIILTVDLVDKVVEEHYISKLHFTWPQASCLSGYPPRGSKTVFMSYKDHIGQARRSNMLLLFINPVTLTEQCMITVILEIIRHDLHCQSIDLMGSIYETSNGIQKFAVRFHTIDEALRFINSLKEIFGQERIDGSMYGISKSKTSSQSQIFSSPQPLNRDFRCKLTTLFVKTPEKKHRNWKNGQFQTNHENINANNKPILLGTLSPKSLVIAISTEDWDPISSSADNSQPMYRPTQDWSPIASPADAYIQPIQPSEDHDASQNSNPLKATLDQDVQEKLSAFPPSFSTLLMNCFPAAEQATEPTVPEEVGLKKEIMKYLEDSSFQDMLSKVQKVISEFGDDLL